MQYNAINKYCDTQIAGPCLCGATHICFCQVRISIINLMVPLFAVLITLPKHGVSVPFYFATSANCGVCDR